MTAAVTDLGDAWCCRTCRDLAPHVYPACADCRHPHGVHLAVRKGAVRQRGPCSSGHGPKGEPCPCPGYVPQIRAEATT